MNDPQIDHLLEQLKSVGTPPPDMTDEAFCTRLRARLARRRRIVQCALAVVVVVLAAAVFAPRLARRPPPSPAPQALLALREAIPECGVALLNDEALTCEQTAVKAPYAIRIMIMDENQVRVAFLDLASDADDYLVFDNRRLAGNLLVSRCGDNEAVLDFDLRLRLDGWKELHLRDILAVTPNGAAATDRDHRIAVQMIPLRATPAT